MSRFSSGSMDLVFVSKTRLFEQRTSASSSYPKQKGPMEMRDEVLPSVGSQSMDTSWYQVSDLQDVDFYWENDRLDIVAVFRPGTGTRFPQQRLTTW